MARPKIEKFHGSLIDAHTGETLRNATAAEAKASRTAVTGDNDKGVIVVEGRSVYVKVEKAHAPTGRKAAKKKAAKRKTTKKAAKKKTAKKAGKRKAAKKKTAKKAGKRRATKKASR